MWLLKTGPWPGGVLSSLELHQREGSLEPYAILSHTWGKLKDEILFEDLVRYCDKTVRQNDGYISVDYRHGPGASLRNKKGWLKVEASIKQARADGYGWVWADTCCIDKSSSAELSEAINSMYAWYEASAVCYGYLADVSSQDSAELRYKNFYGSRWFTRGWTLQELIAPKSVVFYSAEWSPLGNKRSLASAVTAITKIDEGTLNGTRSLESTSIAQRMSWAASRQTSRPEDRAYSLMGLFGVNMPMLYGEGNKAFHRLQQEIMKLSDDQSLFCWVDSEAPATMKHGLLADNPSAFAHATNYRAYNAFDDMKPFDMSNRGLSIDLPVTATKDTNVFFAALHCPVPPTNDGFLAIFLEKEPASEFQYARIRCGSLASLTSRGKPTPIFVKSSFPPQDEWAGVLPAHYLVIRNIYSTNSQIRYSLTDSIGNKPEAGDSHRLPVDDLQKDRSHMKGSAVNTTFKLTKTKGRLSAALTLKRPDQEKLFVLLGACTEFEPGFDLHNFEGFDKLPDEDKLKSLEEDFHPEPLGETVGDQHHRVTARADTRIKDGIKVYFIDLVVRGEPKTDMEDIAEKLDEIKKEVTRMTRMKRLFTN